MESNTTTEPALPTHPHASIETLRSQCAPYFCSYMQWRRYPGTVVGDAAQLESGVNERLPHLASRPKQWLQHPTDHFRLTFLWNRSPPTPPYRFRRFQRACRRVDLATGNRPNCPFAPLPKNLFLASWLSLNIYLFLAYARDPASPKHTLHTYLLYPDTPFILPSLHLAKVAAADDQPRRTEPALKEGRM